MTESEHQIIRLESVNMIYEHRHVLTDVNLTVNRGDFVAITGPNGGGKTTLLRIILKLLRPTSGTVEYLDGEGCQVNSLHIGYLPQKNKIDSRFPITVREVVRSGLLAEKGIGRDEIAVRVDAMLRLMGLDNHASNGLGELSGGQMQRALLGRALISKPSVVVLDEPLSYVDKRFEHHIYDIMERIKGEATVILVSHEISAIASMANRLLIVDGRLHHCNSSMHMARYDSCDWTD